ncbi:MAG TPA: glycosyltransferase [Candidatus Polarisedimenticolia bacterium]|jgi:polysaccharide deacetylase family protein (PEP-CTERM system associated)|nr:glycosyltransferase [Candidatus Polarisedimenticolia bacterium]
MAEGRKHILTVSVEDYFHGASLDGVVARKHWTRIESRLEQSLKASLELLAEHQATATFFVLGWIAERQPEIVRMIRAAGHEIASRGYWPRGGVKGMLPHPQELREELQRAREALEAAGSNRIVGYRHPRWIMRREELWVIDVLVEEGYLYDSSVNPIFRRFAQDPRWFQAHQHRHSVTNQSIWELPATTVSVLGQRVTISGGNYVRQLPHKLMRRGVRFWHDHVPSPIVFYFMPWELDSDQPQIRGMSRLQRIRQYRSLGKTREVFEEYLQTYRFQPIGEWLGLDWQALPEAKPARAAVPELASGEVPLTSGDALDPQTAAGRPPVTLVVPLYNEEANIPYMRGTLLDLRRRLGRNYRIHFNLVDDGSSDGTWERLRERFADFPDCRILHHPKNAGVAAAILTGLRNAPTETVASIDCDCSYDPNDLEAMLPMIEQADLVTASPYHPDGRVFNIPPWRLFLSRTLSRMYSALLGKSISTYTSCFRVYRKSAIEGLKVEHGGFLGVAEILIRLRLQGGRIVEYPTTLESRLFGESKMKIARTIWSHVGLLRELAGNRLLGGKAPTGTGAGRTPSAGPEVRPSAEPAATAPAPRGDRT